MSSIEVFIIEKTTIYRAAASSVLGQAHVSALDDEVFDDSVKSGALVVKLLQILISCILVLDSFTSCELSQILCRFGHTIHEELNYDPASGL
jgi:hypothetical protein